MGADMTLEERLAELTERIKRTHKFRVGDEIQVASRKSGKWYTGVFLKWDESTQKMTLDECVPLYGGEHGGVGGSYEGRIPPKDITPGSIWIYGLDNSAIMTWHGPIENVKDLIDESK